MKNNAPFGTWPSKISANMVAEANPRIGDLVINESRVFWSESVPQEKGRMTIMRYQNGAYQSVLPRPLNAKSKVQEYGGGSFIADGDDVYFVLAEDQRIYHAKIDDQNFTPQPLTPAQNSEYPHEIRYADLCIDRKNERIYAVCEEHTGPHYKNVLNKLVAINMPGEEQTALSQPEVIDDQHDFYAYPRLSNDGKTLAYICWKHPNMPWDHSELWLADISSSGVTQKRQIAGFNKESLFQPEWSDAGDLYFVSDRSNWWNIYRIDAQSLKQEHPEATNICPTEAEFATPLWTFDMATYGVLDNKTIFTTYTEQGIWKLAKLDIESGQLQPIETECDTIYGVKTSRGDGYFIGAAAHLNTSIYKYSDGKLNSLKDPNSAISEEFSRPVSIEFPTTNNDTAYALFYPPANSQFQCKDEKPPLIVLCHGGPTGACDTSLNFKIQYWTNRGFAVADVNYRGSTGYGRTFREKLNDQWGVYDVDDVCAVVNYLTDLGKIDNNRCIIKGSSAGGYTVLAAITFRDTFRAGVSLYGIGDLIKLTEETHKFEAYYLDTLIGKLPESQHVYEQRSPIHAIDKIACPLLLFQGLLDKVVPPNQAEDMFNTLKEKGMPTALVTYADEAHGFRNAENIMHMLDCELQFYAKLFDFEAPKSDFELKIENL